MSVTAVPLQPLKKGSVVKLWIALALLAALAAGLAWWGTSAFQTVTTTSGVGIRTLRAGSGAKITPADVVALHYKLHAKSLESPVIQDSRETGQPFVTTTEGVYREMKLRRHYEKPSEKRARERAAAIRRARKLERKRAERDGGGATR